jgi:GntR family histidine utilization transcriptional repressor
MTDIAARYQTVKQHILERITAGDWPPGARIPSENELVEMLGISRMTVNRAVRELAQEGRVTRLGGVGTFVADGGLKSPPVPVVPIRQWIEGHGGRHSWRVVETARFDARPELAKLYGLAPGTKLAFALVLHAQSDGPIQLEERYVNMDAVPAYAGADLGKELPDDVLARAIPNGSTRSTIEAVQPARRAAELLALKTQEPCLLVTKRIESQGAVASVARLFHPGSRFRLESAGDRRPT